MSELHQVFGVKATQEDGVYIVDAEITDPSGARYRCPYVSTPQDSFGLGVLVRQWLADNAGTIAIEPYTPPTARELRAALQPLTARQLRLGLIDAGIMPAEVQAALEAMPAGAAREKALVEWEYATTFDRLHPLIATVAAVLSLTDATVDAMWAAATAL